MRIGTWFLLALTIVGLVMVVGCGGGDGGNGGPAPQGGTVTGEVYGRSGGSFVPLGGQRVSIGNRTTTTQPGTGRFVITGVPAGPFVVTVTPQPGFGEVLNPNILRGNVTVGQTVDIGRVLLGQRPPDPGL